MSTNSIYNFNVGVHSAEEAAGMSILAMQERFRKLGVSFFSWEKEMVVNMPKKLFLDEVLRIIEELDESISYTNVMVLSPGIVEITLSKQRPESMLETQDELRVYIKLNSWEYYDEYGEETQFPFVTQKDEMVCVANIEVMGQSWLAEIFIPKLLECVNQHRQSDKISLIKWLYSSQHGTASKVFQIRKDWEINPVYYPWLKQHLSELNIAGEESLRPYYHAFLKSQSQILVLFGEPGTGKTSFIRDMICEMGLNALISYDLKVLTSDHTFIEYLTSDIFDLIVVEDADDLLTSSRSENNKVISKILNVSDGIIKLPKKKMIFTTNLRDVSEIDNAVYRLGRCFDVVNFRKLDHVEAQSVADALDIKLPEKKGDSYALSDLFFLKNLGNSDDPFVKRNEERLKKKLGFV